MFKRSFNLILVAIFAISVSVIFFLQALSAAQTRTNPAYASMANPWNGLAYEQLALRQFRLTAVSPETLVASAQKARVLALRAFELEPLTPIALSLTAISEEESSNKIQILDAAGSLNSRNLMLQGLLLERSLEYQDYPSTLATLDRILRVHPTKSDLFFPVLARSLENDDALPALAGILDQGPVWQKKFFQAAVNQPSVLSNLAKLRLSRNKVDAGIDARLISALVLQNEMTAAAEIYERATGRTGSEPSASELSWQSTFPPFDWQLASDSGLRAQPSRDLDVLEVYARSGDGGVWAERIISNPARPFNITFRHNLLPADQVADARLRVACSNPDATIVEHRFSQSENRVIVPTVSCQYIRLSLSGRSWSGRSPVRGSIEKLQLSVD